MEQCSKMSDHGKYSSDSSGVMREKLTESQRSGGSGKTRDSGAKQNERAKRDRKLVEDDVTLTFPQHLMEILENEALREIVAWLPHGKAFILVNKRKFAKEMLGQYFKRSKFSSFTRKLNRWGFQRVARGPDTGAYFHPLFQRSNLRLCLQMTSNGTKATEEYPNHTNDAFSGSVDEKATKRPSDEVRSNVSVGAQGDASTDSLRMADAEVASLARSKAIDEGERLPSRKMASSRRTSMEALSLPAPSTSRFESSKQPVRDVFLQFKTDHSRPGRNGMEQRLFDHVGSAGLPFTSPAAYKLLSLRHVDARSWAQPAYPPGLGGAVPGTGLVAPNGGLPYSSQALAYLVKLQKLEEARSRLSPHLQFQLAQASVAATAPFNSFYPSLLPPLHVQAANDAALFPISADQLYGPEAASKTNAFYKAFSSEYSFSRPKSNERAK